MKRFLLVWLPSLTYMVLIAVFSHRAPLLQRTAGGYYFSGLDKLAHFVEFAVLYVLLCRSFRLDAFSQAPRLALFATVLYAASDELHQSLLTYRDCELGDFLADALGAVALYLIQTRKECVGIDGEDCQS